MPVEIDLIKDNRVVLQTYSDPINSAHMKDLKRRMEKVIFPRAAGSLHIIADFRAVGNVPVMMLTSGTDMLRTSQTDTGTIILVSENAFVSAMGRAFKRLTQQQSIEIVSSLDEALEIIDSLLQLESRT
jgi:hypothetical protein